MLSYEGTVDWLMSVLVLSAPGIRRSLAGGNPPWDLALVIPHVRTKRPSN